MNLTYFLKHPELYPAAIGISQTQFEQLVPDFEKAFTKCWYRKAWSYQRQRGVGGGRKTLLKHTRQRLFFILFYYKTYPTFRLASILFGVDKETIHRWKVFLEQVLWMAIGGQLSLPKKKIKTLTGFMEIFPDLNEFIVDATERRVLRSKDQSTQEFYYSGKKKCHTIKNQVIIHPRTKRILAVSKTVEGKRHDKQLCEDDGVILRAPPGAVGSGDLGYIGVCELNPLIKVALPLKKPRSRELNPEEKETNRVISSVRVRVEHVIGALKFFDILSERYRGKISTADLPLRNIAALYNYTRSATC